MSDALPSRAGLRLRAVLTLFLLAAIVAALLFLPVGEHVRGLLEWTRGRGLAGCLVVIVAYIVATVLFVPGSWLTLAVGFFFGVVAGTVVVSTGATLGAAAAFLVGRYLARDAIERRMAGLPRFRAIDAAVGRAGFKIVLLTRLSPLFPFNLLNYAFGLTRVGFWPYFFASWVGMIPGAILYVYLGATAQDLAQIFSGGVHGGAGQRALQYAGLAATLAVTLYVTRIARRALRESVHE